MYQDAKNRICSEEKINYLLELGFQYKIVKCDALVKM